MKQLIAPLLMLTLFQYCTNASSEKGITTKHKASRKDPITLAYTGKPADAKTILTCKEVPVLCYHHIRDMRPGESKGLIAYIVPADNFKAQIKMLADSGYHTITPDEYKAYLTTGAPLPSKPVMITFDDTNEQQYTVGAKELDKYGFKGVFFIMTISIGRPNYMTREQIKDLADKGHIIGSHTWDHHNVKKYADKDWDAQFLKTKQQLEGITGKPVEHFAYPFGLWNSAAIPQLKKRGYTTAFQLSANLRDSREPLYSLRRMLVPGNWNTASMQKWMKKSF